MRSRPSVAPGVPAVEPGASSRSRGHMDTRAESSLHVDVAVAWGISQRLRWLSWARSVSAGTSERFELRRVSLLGHNERSRDDLRRSSPDNDQAQGRGNNDGSGRTVRTRATRPGFDYH